MSASLKYSEYAKRIKASDRDAFADLFRLMREPLIRYVLRIVRDEAVAHDLIQDSFFSLWKLRESLDPDKSLNAYVYQIARNGAMRYLRDTKTHESKHKLIKEQTSEQIPVEEWPDARVERDSLKQKLNRWISALPDRQREALELSRFQGLTHKEVAEVMKISPRTVNTHITLALKNLQRHIQVAEPALFQL